MQNFMKEGRPLVQIYQNNLLHGWMTNCPITQQMEQNGLKYTLLPGAFSFICPCYPQEVVPDTPFSNLLSFCPTSYHSKQIFHSLCLLILWTTAWCKKMQMSPSSQLLCRISLSFLTWVLEPDQIPGLQKKLKSQHKSWSLETWKQHHLALYQQGPDFYTSSQLMLAQSTMKVRGKNCWFEAEVTTDL